jgi:hypothetical protein
MFNHPLLSKLSQLCHEWKLNRCGIEKYNHLDVYLSANLKHKCLTLNGITASILPLSAGSLTLAYPLHS